MCNRTYKAPKDENLRVEVVIIEGIEITSFYDPIISKLIVWGDTRKIVLERMIQALEDYDIQGIKTNIPMLIDSIQHEAFIKGNVTTSFVTEHYLPMVQKKLGRR